MTGTKNYYSSQMDHHRHHHHHHHNILINVEVSTPCDGLFKKGKRTLPEQIIGAASGQDVILKWKRDSS